MATPALSKSSSTTDVHPALQNDEKHVAPDVKAAPEPSPPVAPNKPRPSVVISDGHFYLIMASLWIGNFAAYFNETTATTAQHTIGLKFNDLPNQNWIATAYLLGFTVTQTLLGKFSDIFGRAGVFNGTLLIFAVGTLWAGLAQSMNSLIGARVLQGIGAAGRQTVGIIVIIDLTTPDSRGMWLGLYNLSLSLGLAVGPILGAVISTDSTWRWLFWMTLMLIGVTFAIGVTSMRYPVPHRQQSVGIVAQLKEVDFIGSILAVAISSLICVAIEMGNKEFPWKSAPIIVLFVVGGALIPVFVLYELRIAKHPVVDIRLFAISNIPIACLINFLTGASYFGAIFFLPRYFIDIKDSSLIRSGVQMFGLIFGLGVSSVLGANAISKTGQVRAVGAFGAIMYAIGGGVMLTVGRDTPSARVIGFSLLMGLGSGILYQPALIVGPMSVKPHQIAGISGFLAFLRTLGGTFATALLTAIFETRFTTELHGKIPDSLVSQGLQLADQHAQYPQYNDLILQALVKGFHVGTIPSVVFGVVYMLGVVSLRNIDFVPHWRKKRIAAKQAAGKV